MKEIKDQANTMKHFRLFKESAAEFQLQNKLAEAHYYTGEHLLNLVISSNQFFKKFLINYFKLI